MPRNSKRGPFATDITLQPSRMTIHKIWVIPPKTTRYQEPCRIRPPRLKLFLRHCAVWIYPWLERVFRLGTLFLACHHWTCQELLFMLFWQKSICPENQAHPSQLSIESGSTPHNECSHGDHLSLDARPPSASHRLHCSLNSIHEGAYGVLLLAVPWVTAPTIC